ncbi:DUF805 domain-containing protein [Jatrophihabitans sp.]|jgi:uncharacterized membrane protein YhaH (DUF805 family)|uniref:DUF805 domain-containing protein n=1 Tax=Jatrophihabitans sp. TaxID=1932789 RepID=UPI002EF0B687
MSFAAAIRSVFSKYVTFSGRARRSEFWWFALFSVIVSVVAAIIDSAMGSSVVEAIVGLALLLPSLAVTVRRLHDTGRSGWWILIGLIPLIGAIVLLVFEVKDSQPGENKYGPSPKTPGADPAWPAQPGQPANPYGGSV